MPSLMRCLLHKALSPLLLNDNGRGLAIDGDAALDVIRHLPVVDVGTGRTAPIGELSALRSVHGE